MEVKRWTNGKAAKSKRSGGERERERDWCKSEDAKGQ